MLKTQHEIIPGQVLTRRNIAVLFGGNARAFLPRTRGGGIVAGCFDPAMNPRVPREVLVHSSPNAILGAQLFITQSGTHSIPVFIKLAPNIWEYVGRFRATRFTRNRREVEMRVYEIHPRLYERYALEYGKMIGILFLEEE